MIYLLDNSTEVPSGQTVLHPDGTECVNSRISKPKLEGPISSSVTLDFHNMIVYDCGGRPLLGDPPTGT